MKELGSYHTHSPTLYHSSKMKSWRTTVGVHLRFKPGWFSPGHPTKHSLGNESTSQLIPTRLLAALPKAFSGALSWLQRGNRWLFGHEGPPRKAWKGRYGSDAWELIQAQPRGSANTSIKLCSWGFGFGLNKFPEVWPLSQDLFMIWTLNFWDFAGGR